MVICAYLRLWLSLSVTPPYLKNGIFDRADLNEVRFEIFWKKPLQNKKWNWKNDKKSEKKQTSQNR